MAGEERGRANPILPKRLRHVKQTEHFLLELCPPPGACGVLTLQDSWSSYLPLTECQARRLEGSQGPACVQTEVGRRRTPPATAVSFPFHHVSDSLPLSVSPEGRCPAPTPVTPGGGQARSQLSVCKVGELLNLQRRIPCLPLYLGPRPRWVAVREPPALRWPLSGPGCESGSAETRQGLPGRRTLRYRLWEKLTPALAFRRNPVERRNAPARLGRALGRGHAPSAAGPHVPADVSAAEAGSAQKRPRTRAPPPRLGHLRSLLQCAWRPRVITCGEDDAHYWPYYNTPHFSFSMDGALSP